VSSGPPDNDYALLRVELRAGFEGLREEFQRALAATESSLRQELGATDGALRRHIDETAGGLRHELAAGERRLRDDVREQITQSQGETRRDMGVIAEELTGKLELVIEGVRGVDERLERFRGEVARDFQAVDRRFLHLEAWIHGRS